MKVTMLMLYASIYCRHVMACGLELEGLKRVMREQQSKLFEHYDLLCAKGRFEIPSFDIRLDEEAISKKIFNFQLPSDALPITIEEVADRLYWDEGLESFSLPGRLGQSRINLFKSLYKIAFKAYDLTFNEIRALLVLEGEKDAAEFEFGRAPTYPLIADFICAISSNPAYKIRQIKENLIAHYKDISKALTQGRSYNIIAIALQRRAYSWILDYSLLTRDNVQFSKILYNICALYNDYRIPVFRRRLLDISDQIKDFLVPLSRLPEQAAMEKLLLMVGFPQYATYIYEHTSAEASKFIFGTNLTAWRAEMANSLEWERIRLMSHLPFMYLEYQNNYYDGYLVNSKFDELIYSLKRNGFLALFNEEDGGIFAESIRTYERRVVMEERLGTVYSILQEKLGLVGQIDPLSEKVNDNFEGKIIMTYSRIYDGWNFWLGQKYLQSVKVLMSRLVFRPRYNMHSYFRDSFQDDRSNFINIIQDIHSSIAKICSLPENLTLCTKAMESNDFDYRLFNMVSDNLIRHCVPEVCIPSILNYLDGGGDEDLVTSKLLLILLRGVALKRSYSEAKQICFDCFSEELKNGLLNLLKR